RIDRDRPLAGAAPQLLEQLRLQAAGVENRLEPACRELLNLLVGEVDAAPLRDARADVAHDLLDVHAVRALGAIGRLLRGWTRPPLGPTPIGTPAPAMEVAAAPLVVIHRHLVVSLSQDNPARSVVARSGIAVHGLS